jgi:glycosyltransferase involved in cell wall biosynthesis
MLKRAIRSCLNQTLPSELIVVDEASDDDTSDLVKSIPNVKYIRNARAVGHSAAMNLGIRAATGSWIKPLDDDDWLAPNCIQEMSAAVKTAESRGFYPVLVTGAVVNVDEAEREISRTRPLAEERVIIKSLSALELMLVDRAPIGTPVQVGHNREVALSVNGWNENRRFTHQHGDEVEFWIRLIAGGDVIFLPGYIASRTIWSGGSQERIPPEERFLSNLYLKDLICTELGIETPEAIKSYLALHWALVAARHQKFLQAARLGSRWLKHPSSAKYLFKRGAEISAMGF